MTAPVLPALLCPVCLHVGNELIYQREDIAVTSTARLMHASTMVYACARCTHVYTRPVEDIAGYYDREYNVHLESDDADDLYEVIDGRNVYRAEHQALVADRMLTLARGASVLDFGCGKGMTLRELLGRRPDIEGAVFDVSDAYRSIWSTFVPPANQAAHTVPDSWLDRFDAVLSFFALEHVADPRAFLALVRRLLKPGGRAHLTVPNMARNVGDFLVVDHVNHFTPPSLRYLFAACGFGDISIDEDSHAAAYVVEARRQEGTAAEPPFPASDDADAFMCATKSYANFWRDAAKSVRQFERDVAGDRRAAIYGSAFYGMFIASSLADLGRVEYFIDRNPHQQAKTVMGKQVRSPELLDQSIDVIYAGLNPAAAPGIIAGVPGIHDHQRELFVLTQSIETIIETPASSSAAQTRAVSRTVQR